MISNTYLRIKEIKPLTFSPLESRFIVNLLNNKSYLAVNYYLQPHTIQKIEGILIVKTITLIT